MAIYNGVTQRSAPITLDWLGNISSPAKLSQLTSCHMASTPLQSDRLWRVVLLVILTQAKPATRTPAGPTGPILPVEPQRQRPRVMVMRRPSDLGVHTRRRRRRRPILSFNRHKRMHCNALKRVRITCIITRTWIFWPFSILTLKSHILTRKYTFLKPRGTRSCIRVYGSGALGSLPSK